MQRKPQIVEIDLSPSFISDGCIINIITRLVGIPHTCAMREAAHSKAETQSAQRSFSPCRSHGMKNNCAIYVLTQPLDDASYCGCGFRCPRSLLSMPGLYVVQPCLVAAPEAAPLTIFRLILPQCQCCLDEQMYVRLREWYLARSVLLRRREKYSRVTLKNVILVQVEQELPELYGCRHAFESHER